MPQIMTPANYESIQVGSPFATVEQQYGAPYDVIDLGDGTTECRYIHRYDVGPGCREHIHYIYRVCNGKIIYKTKQCIGAPIDINTP